MTRKAPNPPPPKGLKRPAPPPGPPAANELPADRERRKARERKARQRKRDKLLDMQPWGGKFSSGERKLIASGALAGGFDDPTEYLFSLVRADSMRLCDK